ncbi:alpha-2-antiplasmin [Microcaecilia unicolor]|uniref:Alpha-2-antiplasmin n=1 Tax=Microcaecilia unicolor TaxID=1415580 RepID=A0A6P7ZXL6_9AMPH|nr:alpha-2-antiplasmin [Microcaecilia unicolor]
MYRPFTCTREATRSPKQDNEEAALATFFLFLSGLQPPIKGLELDWLFYDPDVGETDEHSGEVANVTKTDGLSFETTTTSSSPLYTDSSFQDSTSDTWEDIYPHANTTAFPQTSTTSPVEVTTATEDQVVPGITEQSSVEGSDLEGDQEDFLEEGEDEERRCKKTVSLKEMHSLAEAMIKFSIDLFKQVHLESKTPNVLLSPFSIFLSLSQLALGAGNQTEKQLLESLHIDTVTCLHSTLKSARKELTKTILSIAARIYTKKGFQMKEKFLKRSESFYGAKPVNLIGKSDDDLKAINKWVKEVTGGKITKFLSYLPEDLVLLLLNAVNFKGLWRNKFDPSLTTQDMFHLNEQDVVTVEMMNAQQYPLSWYPLNNLEIARFPFKGNISFVVIMPNTYEWDALSVLRSLNYTELFSRFPREMPTLVKIPKLVLEFQLELNHALTRMGLGELFSQPDFHKISDETLLVSSIQHQTTLELKEDGVEASAVTGVLMFRSFLTFSINRPFIFFLYHETTGFPLFLGQVRNPKPNTNPNPNSSVKRTELEDSPDLKHFVKGIDPK